MKEVMGCDFAWRGGWMMDGHGALLVHLAICFYVPTYIF